MHLRRCKKNIIDILWKEKAWAYTACSVEYSNNTLRSLAKNFDKFMLCVVT